MRVIIKARLSLIIIRLEKGIGYSGFDSLNADKIANMLLTTKTIPIESGANPILYLPRFIISNI